MYYVIEIQKLQDGSFAHLVFHQDEWTRPQAESVFHGKVQYAAISEIPLHTVIFFDAEGAVYDKKVYDREQVEE